MSTFNYRFQGLFGIQVKCFVNRINLILSQIEETISRFGLMMLFSQILISFQIWPLACEEQHRPMQQGFPEGSKLLIKIRIILIIDTKIHSILTIIEHVIVELSTITLLDHHHWHHYFHENQHITQSSSSSNIMVIPRNIFFTIPSTDIFTRSLSTLTCTRR